MKKRIAKKLKAIRVHKPKAARTSKMLNAEAVEITRKFLASAYERRIIDRVWMLVTALRGPDSESILDKENYTTKIRRALLTYKMTIGLPVAASPSFFNDLKESEGTLDAMALFPHSINHFERHAQKAAAVLVGTLP